MTDDHAAEPVPADLAKSLTNLREEHEKLSRSFTRVAIATLSAYFFLCISFSHAVAKINGAELQDALTQLESLAGASHKGIEVPLFLRFFQGKEVAVAAPAKPVATDQETAKQRQEEIEAGLAKKAQEWFTVKVALLGLGYDLDLRYWILFAPFLILGSGAYLYILSKKRRLLVRMGTHWVRLADPTSLTALDRLFFEGPGHGGTPYLRYPANLEVVTFMAAAAVLTVKLVIDVSPLAGALTDTSTSASFITPDDAPCHFGCSPRAPRWWDWFLVWSVLGLTIGYAVGYAGFFGIILERQVDAVLGASCPGFVRRRWASLNRVFRALLRPLRQRPKLSVSAGSLLVLLSLPLATAFSCNGKARTGVDLLLAKSDARWFTGIGDPLPRYEIPTAVVGWLLYAASLTVAASSLWLVVVRRWRPLLVERRCLMQAGLVVCGVTTLFVTASLGLHPHVRSLTLFSDLPIVACALVAAILWSRSRLSHKRGPAERWRNVRPYILVLFLPIAMRGIVILILLSELQGLVAFCTGNCLMTVGYLGAMDGLPPGKGSDPCVRAQREVG